MSKFSRSKGVRGEQFIAKALNAKRVGIAFKKTAIDVEGDYFVGQVRNCPQSSKEILDALIALEKEASPTLRKFVFVKPRRGTWLVIQRLEQFCKEK